MAASPRMPAPLLAGGTTDDALRAEHGFSALVTVTKEGRETRGLFGAGRTPDGLVENMRRLDLSPGDIDIIVLRHGHWDHVTGMDGLVGRLGRTNLPVLIHPEFWTRRRLAFPGRDPVELPSTSKSALEGAGFEIVEQRLPSFLLDGSLLVTGEVDRTTEFERGFPGHEAHRPGGWEPDPLDPRRSGPSSDDTRARPRRADQLRALGGHQIPALCSKAHGRGSNPRRPGRPPPQRSGVRTDYRTDVRRARRFLAGVPCARALHGLAGHSRARLSLSGGVHSEQRRHALQVRGDHG